MPGIEGTDEVEDAQASAGGDESHGNPHGAGGVHITEGAKDHQALRQAVAYVVRHPGTTVRRSLIKFADFWGIEREFVAGVEWGFFNPPQWFAILASLVIGIGYVLVALFGAAGIWLAAPSERRLHIALLLPVVAITGAHTLAFAHSRYHFPLIPILILYGSALATRSEITWRRYQPALIGATIAVTVLLGIWVRQIIVVDAERLRGFLHHVI